MGDSQRKKSLARVSFFELVNHLPSFYKPHFLPGNFFNLFSLILFHSCRLLGELLVFFPGLSEIKNPRLPGSETVYSSRS